MEIGRKVQTGLGLESTPGTPVIADFWQPTTAKGLNPKTEVMDDEADRGTIVAQGQSEIIREWSEPNIEGLIRSESFGLLMLVALGSVSTSADTPESGVYTHTFSLLDSNSHPTLTIIENDSVFSKQASYCVLNTLGIEAVTNEFVKFTANFIGKKIENVSPTPAQTNETRFVPKYITTKLADNVAGLNAASAIALEGFNLNIEKNVESYFPFGNSEPTSINNGSLRVSGELTLRFENLDQLNNFLDGSKKALRFTLENTGVTIGATTNPKIQIDLGSVSFRDWNRDTASDSFIMQTIPFTAELPATDAFIAAQIINSTVSYS